ncbi:hypothetical protein HYV50_04400 [Candidatus Pacearchaeota archaeon]|nr:hypothetical protein [Candidatus Pacearchaeota archaeon]
MKKIRIVGFVILALIFIALAIWSSFFYRETCETFECFQEAMKKCSSVNYINEETEATWKYEILGEDGRECRVEVILLQPKVGELEIERLTGLGMECTFPKGIAIYPEKNLDRCHGRLKEELQTILIKKMHTYIVENLGKIEQGLGAFGGES